MTTAMTTAADAITATWEGELIDEDTGHPRKARVASRTIEFDPDHIADNLDLYDLADSGHFGREVTGAEVARTLLMPGYPDPGS